MTAWITELKSEGGWIVAGLLIALALIKYGATWIRAWSETGNTATLIAGTLETGRDIQTMGAHVAAHNEHSIGLCLIGGKGHDGSWDCNFTYRQGLKML